MLNKLDDIFISRSLTKTLHCIYEPKSPIVFYIFLSIIQKRINQINNSTIVNYKINDNDIVGIIEYKPIDPLIKTLDLIGINEYKSIITNYEFSQLVHAACGCGCGGSRHGQLGELNQRRLELETKRWLAPMSDHSRNDPINDSINDYESIIDWLNHWLIDPKNNCINDPNDPFYNLNNFINNVVIDKLEEEIRRSN